ncbi:MAG TPA: hypothetical protein VFK13_11345 [Gemmatimonadaceae bacterium]|nr:hypothetical protein [Gemmatimonadaceae bacterium]
MNRCWFAPAIMSLAIAMSPLHAVRAQRFPVRVTAVDTIGRELALGVITDQELGSDGSMYLVDFSNNQILKFNPAGDLQWRVGRKGQAPGEYLGAYRVAAGADGRVRVFDIFAQQVTVLDSSGQYVDRRALPLVFDAFDQMVVLPDGGLAVAGVTHTAPGVDRAIHIFDSSFRHVRSFGPLPETKRPEVLPYWGAGGLSLSRDGDLLYTRRIPYEIYRYSPDGELRQRINAAFGMKYKPEDAIRVEYGSDNGHPSRTIESADVPVVRPLGAFELGDGLILGGRSVRNGAAYGDLFSTAGKLLATTTWPDQDPPFCYDPRRHVLWFVGEVADEPVVIRKGVVIAATASSGQ